MRTLTLDKALKSFADRGITPAKVRIEPDGAMEFTLGDGTRLTSPEELAEFYRQKDRIGQYGAHRWRFSAAVAAVRERLKENWPHDAKHAELKAKWGFLLNHAQAAKFSRLNPNWTGPEDTDHEWPAGKRNR